MANFRHWLPGRPSASTIAAVVGLFLLVGGLGMVQSVVKVQQVTTPGEAYGTAAWMAEYADERGWETRAEGYVLSRWPRNRMYNYFVNGNAKSYSYARQTYGGFITATKPNAMYDQLRGRAAFIVIGPNGPFDNGNATMYQRLYTHYGSRYAGVQGTAHYRAVYASPGGTYKMFRPVRGAILTGLGPPNATIDVTATVTINGTSFTYTRQASTVENGWFWLRVPYAATYTVDNGTAANVSATDVTQGGLAVDRQPRAHWSFDEGRGTHVFDSIGGNHGVVRNGTWAPGIANQSLVVGDHRYARVPNPRQVQDGRPFTLTLWFKPARSANYSARPFARIASTANASAYRDTDGYQIDLSRGRLAAQFGNGTAASKLFGPNVLDGQWHHVALSWNGTIVSLYLDGQLVDTAKFTGTPDTNPSLVFGASADARQHFVGRIDEVRYVNRSLSAASIKDIYMNGLQRCRKDAVCQTDGEDDGDA